VIAAHDLYCCLLPQCEALRTGRSGFSNRNTMHSTELQQLHHLEIVTRMCNLSSQYICEVRYITPTPFDRGFSFATADHATGITIHLQETQIHVCID